MNPRSRLATILRLVRPGSSAASLRLLIVSTPRAGSTWTRTLLTRLYGFHKRRRGELAVHDPDDIPWTRLPRRCIVQLHWHRTASFCERLEEYGFRRLTVVRHPFDVLLSILRYSQYTKETARWLGGECGDESTLRGAGPRSEAFLSYATGPRAAALLSVSAEWWSTPGALQLRYEDLVADTAESVRGLGSSLGYIDPQRADQVIASCAIDRLGSVANAPHFWQGKPGLWKALFTVGEAERIATTHQDVFNTFGYEVNADPNLTSAEADANWLFLRDNPRSSRTRKSA